MSRLLNTKIGSKQKTMKTTYIVLFCLLLAACVQEETISTQTHEGKIVGYAAAALVANGTVNYGDINTSTATASNKAVLAVFSTYTNQGMVQPEGTYSIPTPWNLIAATVKVPQIRRIGLVTNTVDVIDSRISLKPLVGLAYSPPTKKTYGIVADTVFDYTVNEANKTMLRGTRYGALGLGTDMKLYSSTAHGELPYIYIAAGRSIRRLDLSTGTYTNLAIPTPAGTYYGIRYNAFNKEVYVIKASSGSATTPIYTLEKINQANNTLSTVLTLPSTFTINANYTYSATIHCCQNKYIFFDNGRFHNIDLNKNTVEVVNSTSSFQGMVWVNN